jgi:hypothetical protein
MKIQLTSNITCTSTGIKFFKGRIYSADVATNQKGAIRLVKNQTDLKIKKVFVKRPEGSLLLDQNDFKIISFPELKELLFNYKQSKIHFPREKREIPRGYILRDNFRKITEKELSNKNLMYCVTGTSYGPCRKPAEFIKIIGPRIKTTCCMRHSTFVSGK